MPLPYVNQLLQSSHGTHPGTEHPTEQQGKNQRKEKHEQYHQRQPVAVASSHCKHHILNGADTTHTTRSKKTKVKYRNDTDSKDGTAAATAIYRPSDKSHHAHKQYDVNP